MSLVLCLACLHAETCQPKEQITDKNLLHSLNTFSHYRQELTYGKLHRCEKIDAGKFFVRVLVKDDKVLSETSICA